MESVLEQQRRLHEERERVEDALMKERMMKKSSVSSQIVKTVTLCFELSHRYCG